jgi:predicted glycoside hydrolase/deacetylase ChbG (UPF0249 family)
VALAWAARGLPLAEVEVELRSQISLARSLGASVDHLDAHQHLHLLPGVARVVETLAAEEGLPLRWPSERPHLGWARRPGAAAKSALLSGLASLRQGASAVRRVRAVGLFEAG